VPNKLFNTNPDSFRGKLYLLVFDKVVVGALIAVALFAYKRWETSDQRAYENRTTLAFQRAGFVKELVPMVVDPTRDLSARSQALIALIETGSVGDKNALGLTALLLRQGLIRSTDPEHSVWNHDHPLIDTLMNRMPYAMEPLLDQVQVEDALARLDERDPISGKERSHSDVPEGLQTRDSPGVSKNRLESKITDEFWSELFNRAVDKFSDSELALLDSDEFLSTHLDVMSQLASDRKISDSHDQSLIEDGPLQGQEARVSWFARKLKGLRILAALRSAGPRPHRLGREYLLTLVSPSQPTRGNMMLAGSIIRTQKQWNWVSKALATRCLEIFVNGDEDMRTTHDYWYRFYAALDYLQWYATAKRDADWMPGGGGKGWDEIQPAVVAGLRSYLSRISHEKVEARDFIFPEKRQRIAPPLARLLVEGIERGEQPSESTRQLLREMASFSNEKLHALELDIFLQRISGALKQ
jgi:hypothetical protein